MPGRRKEPIELLLLKGNKHFTKKEIEERRNSEIKAPTNNIKYPKYLPKDLRKDFTYHAKILLELGIFSDLDIDTLARYLIQRHEYLKTVEIMSEIHPAVLDLETGTYVANDVYDTLRMQQNTFYTQCRQAAADLGLTVSSRLKLVVPKTSDDKEPSEFEKRFDGV
jgi:P27 family predicted phage terminase small subunit